MQQRCRKALVIRAYNTRPADQSLEEQFSSFTYLKGDGNLYTNAELIKQCLSIGSNDYPWLEPLLQILSESHQQPGEASSSKPKVVILLPKDPRSDINGHILYYDNYDRFSRSEWMIL